MKTHPHIEIITAYYNGACLQVRSPDGQRWSDLPRYCPHGEDTPSFNPGYTYRVKPKVFPLLLNEDEMKEVKNLVAWANEENGRYSVRESLSEKIKEAEEKAEEEEAE